MLQRNVEVFNDLLLLRNDANQFVVKGVGVEIVQTDPFHAFDLHELLQKDGEAGLAVKLLAPACDVLRDHDQFLHALRCQCSGFRQNGVERAAPVLSADRRDGAEGAPVVAALSDAQIRPARAGADDTADLLHRTAFVRK